MDSLRPALGSLAAWTASLALLGCLLSPATATASATEGCACVDRAPLEVALAASTDVVLARVQSSNSSRSMSVQSAGNGQSRRTTRVEYGWTLRIEEPLTGSLSPGQLVRATYTELACTDLMGPGPGVVTPEGLAGQAGTCLGSGREVEDSSPPRLRSWQVEPDPSAQTGDPLVVLLHTTPAGSRLLRIATPEEAQTMRDALGRRTGSPSAGSNNAADLDRTVLFGTDPRLADLAWLAGAWVREEHDGQTEEHWTQPAGGTMLGVHRLVQEGKTAFTERITLGIDDEERVFYEVQPSFADTPTRYLLVERSPRHMVFANPEHDWPTHIRYALLDTGMLEMQAYGGDKTSTWTLKPATVTLPRKP